jgi:multidrug efflux system membrane fusion protein
MPPLFLARRFAPALFVAACTASASAPPASPPPPPAVGIAPAAERELAISDELSGRVEALHHVAVRPRVAGYITAVSYREGAEVAAGSVLFTIDPRPYQAALARAQADVARAQARLALAKTDAERAEKLLAANAIPRAERDTLASTATQAQAELAGAEAAVALARLDVEFTQVRAPFAGRTGRAEVNVGDYASAGPAPTELTTIASTDPVYVYFTGDEQTYLRYAAHAEHSRVEVGLADEDGFPHTGTVDFVDNRLDAGTGTILVRAVVPNPDKRLAPGLFARVRLPEGAATKHIVVDDKAILTDQDRKYVYVLGAGDTVERRDVTLGREIEGGRVVERGLAAGDRVIVSGTQKVFPGGKATIAAAEPTRTGSVP